MGNAGRDVWAALHSQGAAPSLSCISLTVLAWVCSWNLSFVDLPCICAMGLSTMSLLVAAVLPSSPGSPISLQESCRLPAFPEISLHLSRHLLMVTEKMTFLTGRYQTQSNLLKGRESREPGPGAWPSSKAAHPGGIHLLGALGAWCVQHNLICAWNINPGCCRHAAWGFTSSFVKTALSPSTAAARSFPGNPIPAISEICRGS